MKTYLATFRIYDDNLGLGTCNPNKRFDVLKYQLNEGNININDLKPLYITEELITKNPEEYWSIMAGRK